MKRLFIVDILPQFRLPLILHFGGRCSFLVYEPGATNVTKFSRHIATKFSHYSHYIVAIVTNYSVAKLNSLPYTQ